MGPGAEPSERTGPRRQKGEPGPATARSCRALRIQWMRRERLSHLTSQRGIDNRQVAVPGDVLHLGNAQNALQLSRGNHHRSGVRRLARRRLGKGSRSCGVERDVAFHLLHHLVDVPVQHGHGAETASGTTAPPPHPACPSPNPDRPSTAECGRRPRSASKPKATPDPSSASQLIGSQLAHGVDLRSC